MNKFEQKIDPRSELEKSIDKGKEIGFDKEPEAQVERKEENDFYSLLKKEIKEKRAGGADSHFSQITIDTLSNDVLDLYVEYKRKKPGFEVDLKNFMGTVYVGGNEYNFAAMIMNWYMNYIADKKHKEREQRKKLKLAA